MISYFERLELHTEQKKTYAFVGGGGKTSLIFRLTEELTAAGKKVIIATTTHMAYEPERPFAAGEDRKKIRENLEKYGYTMVGEILKEQKKMAALPEEVLKSMEELCDVLLIEADGSKRLPVKAPEEWEPVIPPFADGVIGVIGLDCLGKEIRLTAHRPHRVAELLGKPVTEVLTEADLIRMAVSPQGLRKQVGERLYRVYFNKSDVLKESAGKSSIPETLIRNLACKGVKAAYGSLLHKKLAMFLLASGYSRRFHGNKLLFPVEGIPMYQRILNQMEKARELLGPVYDSSLCVVTQYEEIADFCRCHGIKVLRNPHPENGISSSLKIGLAAEAQSEACLFTVGDQPFMKAESICELAELFYSSHCGIACMADEDGKLGNPCIFSRNYYGELQSLTGDTGGKQVIRAHREDTAVLTIHDRRQLQDIDSRDHLQER